MTFMENSGTLSGETSSKHVRIAEQNLTLQYRPKSYSMPDLVQVDTFRTSFHKHPNIHLSTRVTSDSIDIRNFLPKKTSVFKSRFTNQIKTFRHKLSEVCKTRDIHVNSECDVAKSKNIFVRSQSDKQYGDADQSSIKCFTFFKNGRNNDTVLMRSSASKNHRDYKRSRSENNLQILSKTTRDADIPRIYKPFSEGFKRIEYYRRRVVSEDEFQFLSCDSTEE